MRTFTTIILAYLITEDESHLINADEENFVLLKQLLESCLENPEHQSTESGFWAFEILGALNVLAAIDSNKVYL